MPHIFPPNNALHDQLRAFDWIHQNIAGFGGDPDRITALGQSAGSMSLALHSISANPDPLFQQIVCLSGSPVTMPSKSPARYDETFSSLAEKLGVQDIPKKNATEFAHEFTHAQLEKIRDLSYVGAPCTSSEILPVRTSKHGDDACQTDQQCQVVTTGHIQLRDLRRWRVLQPPRIFKEGEWSNIHAARQEDNFPMTAPNNFWLCTTSRRPTTIPMCSRRSGNLTSASSSQV